MSVLRKTDETMTIEEAKRQNLQFKIDQYGDMLFKICYLRLQNVQDAEDVVQETFYQYIRREAPFEGEEHEKAWLIQVAMNACRKIWRSAWMRHRTGEEPDPKTPSSTEAVEEKMVRAEESRNLLHAVMLLPVKYRDVIHLFYYEEFTIKEIAEITGQKVSTVTSQLTRGRKLLKKSLKEDYDFA